MAASLVVVLAGLKAAAQLVLPFLLSLFIAVLSLPLLYWFKSRRIPNGLAVLATILVDVAFLAGLVSLVGGSVNEFRVELPKYQQRLEEMASSAVEWVETHGVSLDAWRRPEDVAEPVGDEGDQTWLYDLINPGAVLNLVGGTLGAVAAVLSNALLVVLATVFILLEAATFPAKLRAAFAVQDPGDRFAKVTREVQRYLGIKTIISLVTGVLIGLWAGVLGIDFPLLWGLTAFLFNYIPNFGSILAAIPTVLLATIQFGLGRAALVGLGYLVVNVVLGNFVEPHLMGRRLGLSTLVVFLSLVFWGWMWGPMGMLLSVPLTMIVKIMLENTADFRWVAILLDVSSESESTDNPPGLDKEPRPEPVPAASDKG